MSPTSAIARLRANALTLLVAGLGAALFAVIGLPLPYLMGPLVATAIGRSWRAMTIWAPFRDAALCVLGLQIGASMTPQSAQRLAELPLAALGLALGTGASMTAGYLVYRRLAGWDRETAFLASAPGALSSVLAIIAERDVDAARVTLAQSIRLSFLVIAFPLALPAPAAAPSAEAWTLASGLTVAGVGVVAGALLSWRRAPAGWVLGPAVVAAAFSVSGLAHGGPPPWLFKSALVVVGAATGARIAASPLDAWRTSTRAALAALAAMLATAGAAAVVTALALGLPLEATLLAFAPGAFEAMVALAVALDVDPAFVSAAHVLRVLALTIALPIAHRALGPGKPADAARPGEAPASADKADQ